MNKFFPESFGKKDINKSNKFHISFDSKIFFFFFFNLDKKSDHYQTKGHLLNQFKLEKWKHQVRFFQQNKFDFFNVQSVFDF